MKIAPTRQQLMASAMVSIIFCVAMILVVGWIYWRFNGTFNEISNNAQGGVPRLIRSFKEIIFVLVPAICAGWIALSLSTLLYVNEESDKVL